MELRLPELGEGIADATVTALNVVVGQPIAAGDTVIEVETDKASVPIPATEAGAVTSIAVKTGDKIKVGGLILSLSGTGSPQKAAPPPPVAPTPPTPAPAAIAPLPTSTSGPVDFKLPNLGEGIDGGVVVAVGVRAGDSFTVGQELATVETDKASVPLNAEAAGTVVDVRVKVGDKITVGATMFLLSTTAAAASTPVTAKPATTTKSEAAPIAAPTAAAGVVHSTGIVPAGPATRRYAREHNVALAEVAGSARGGRVTVDDVKQYIRKRMATPAVAAPSTGASTGLAIPPLPDFSKIGPVERKPLSNLRKKIAENLTLSWHVAPAVTQFDHADITDLEAGRKRIVEGLPKGAPKVTMTVLAIKAVVAALKEFPHFNSSLDPHTNELVVKQYYNIGIAVDTERGLVVPVIRDAEKKSIRDLAQNVAELADKARSGKLSIDEMRGGGFTITNLGGIGGTAFSPIINYPEVAILGLAKSSIQPAYRDTQFVARLMMPLCLTYDHRVIDGADGARFTARLVQLFSDPIRLLMES